jgi:hypothetical protein
MRQAGRGERRSSSGWGGAGLGPVLPGRPRACRLPTDRPHQKECRTWAGGSERQPAPALSTTKTFFSRTSSSSQRSWCRHLHLAARGNIYACLRQLYGGYATFCPILWPSPRGSPAMWTPANRSSGRRRRSSETACLPLRPWSNRCGTAGGSGLRGAWPGGDLLQPLGSRGRVRLAPARRRCGGHHCPPALRRRRATGVRPGEVRRRRRGATALGSATGGRGRRGLPRY